MKQVKRLFCILVIIAMALSVFACSNATAGDYAGGLAVGFAPGDYKSESESDAGAAEGAEGDPDNADDEEKMLPSGMITAGAWMDNDNYQMWLELFAQGEGDEDSGKFWSYTKGSGSWGFNSLDRVKVTVKCGENAVAGAAVVAYDAEGAALYAAVSDAQGNAYLFPDAAEGTVRVTSGEGSCELQFSADSRELKADLAACASKLNVIEIMFVVDVTGSMGDEIEFLKAELRDVISKISENDSETVIKLALLFYRDTDDETPFDYYDFKDVTYGIGMSAQQNALNGQFAMGGGDYPEAVDKALAMAVNEQWSTENTTKLIFHVLDAPAHDGEKYKKQFAEAVEIAAEKGIRICPIICSGSDEVTEYTMREAAIHTGGTFIFVTDDSGIGGAHHDPGLPNATVELLNSMLVRLVKGYHTGVFEAPIYWKNDPNLTTE